MTRFFTLLLLLFTVHLAQAQLSPITKVTLEFTPTSGAVVTASATDTGNGLTIQILRMKYRIMPIISNFSLRQEKAYLLEMLLMRIWIVTTCL